MLKGAFIRRWATASPSAWRAWLLFVALLASVATASHARAQLSDDVPLGSPKYRPTAPGMGKVGIESSAVDVAEVAAWWVRHALSESFADTRERAEKIALKELARDRSARGVLVEVVRTGEFGATTASYGVVGKGSPFEALAGRGTTPTDGTIYTAGSPVDRYGFYVGRDGSREIVGADALANRTHWAKILGPEIARREQAEAAYRRQRALALAANNKAEVERIDRERNEDERASHERIKDAERFHELREKAEDATPAEHEELKEAIEREEKKENVARPLVERDDSPVDPYWTEQAILADPLGFARYMSLRSNSPDDPKAPFVRRRDFVEAFVDREFRPTALGFSIAKKGSGAGIR